MVQVTLEMVDEVINRTNAGYKEAKEALLACEGDVLEAVVYIETNKESTRGFGKDIGDKTNELIDKAKEIIKKGNVTSLVVEKNDRKLLDIPATAGGIAAIVSIWATVLGIIVAFGTGCVIKIIKDDGEVINVNDLVFEQVDNIKEKASDIKDKFSKNESSKNENEDETDSKFEEFDNLEEFYQEGDAKPNEAEQSEDDVNKI
jgi:hypothetical protein